MALTPTEREEHFFKAIVDVANGSTPEELEPTERKEHWYKEIIDAIKSGGGSGGGVLVVTDTDGTLDKTWQEIVDAFLTGAVRITTSEGVYSVNHCFSDVGSNTFVVEYVSAGLRTAVILTYATNSADGYPTNA
jgi:hypothetical protein